ncbi:MAG: methyl-accepting chemotaxis protein, partial [Spirochaetaceae bacterium]|nr:methyl-accepting chemotaxis protein [Spirochaetaceae bacterium]
MSTPLHVMAEAFDCLSQGDLTRQLTVKTKDEIGMIARVFNETVDNMKRMVQIIQEQSRALFNVGAELSTNMLQTASAINEITANIKSVKGQVLGQSASVTETNATMREISGNIGQLGSHVGRQGESVAQSSSAVEEMIANIQSVSQTLSKNMTNVQGLIEASEVGRSGLQEVATDIQEIARESDGLLEINAVMENIA